MNLSPYFGSLMNQPAKRLSREVIDNSGGAAATGTLCANAPNGTTLAVISYNAAQSVVGGQYFVIGIRLDGTTLSSAVDGITLLRAHTTGNFKIAETTELTLPVDVLKNIRYAVDGANGKFVIEYFGKA